MSFSDFVFLPPTAFLLSFIVGYVLLAVYGFVRNSV